MKIFSIKKCNGIQGKKPIRTKIIVNDKIIERLSHFKYLQNYIFYDQCFYTDVKLYQFQTMYGAIGNSLIVLETKYYKEKIKV